MIDANVTCRHLGFVWGNFTYHSFSRNKTEYMLFEKPNCDGDEDSLFTCTGANAMGIKVGHHICGMSLYIHTYIYIYINIVPEDLQQQ